MVPDDKQQFLALIAGTASMYRADLDAAALELYWQSLRGLSFEGVRDAVATCCRECQWLPTPSQIRDRLPQKRVVHRAPVIEYRTGTTSQEADTVARWREMWAGMDKSQRAAVENTHSFLVERFNRSECDKTRSVPAEMLLAFVEGMERDTGGPDALCAVD